MAINLADILNLGLTAYNASQGNAGGAASGLSGILGPIFSSGTAPTTGGQGGGFLSSIFGSDSPVSENPVSEGGGIMDSLGSIFGSSNGPTGYTGPSVWPQVLGSLASSFRATPRAGASREEREKANRYNLLAGILGAVATGYGKASDEAAKQKATSELYQIFSGAQPATAAVKATPEAGASVDIPGVTPETPTPLSRNERLAEFMRQNPAMAGVAGQLLAKEQENQLKLIDLARKAGGRPLTYLDALTIAEKEGTPPELRAQQAQILMDQQSKDQVARLEPFRSEFEKRGIPLPSSTTEPTAKMPSIIAPSVTAPTREEQPSIQRLGGINIQATPSSQYEEASRILGQPITPSSSQPETYGKRPETLADIRAATQTAAEEEKTIKKRELTVKEEQTFASQLKDIQTSEGYKQNVEKLRGQSSTLNKLAALTTEIAKRPDGRIKPQDRVQLAKLAINAIEPGLSVNEGEAAQALIPDSAWWNSRPGRIVADVFGRNEIPVDSLDALLKTTGAYVKAQQNAATDYLENEVRPTYSNFLQGEKLIGAVQRAIPETDPFEIVNNALGAINKAKGIKVAPRGYIKKRSESASPEASAPITKTPNLMGYVNGRPVIGIVRR
jgi:hypothetical protein